MSDEPSCSNACNQPKNVIDSMIEASKSSTARTRNAFMHFLNVYREVNKCKQPMSELTKNAAQLWNRMTLNDKCEYIAAARNANYKYRARDRRANRLLSLLRKALQCENNVNVVHLARAIKELQSWKRQLMKELLCASNKRQRSSKSKKKKACH